MCRKLKLFIYILTFFSAHSWLYGLHGYLGVWLSLKGYTFRTLKNYFVILDVFNIIYLFKYLQTACKIFEITITHPCELQKYS